MSQRVRIPLASRLGILGFAVLVLLGSVPLMATEQAFAPAPVGVPEVTTLPAGVLLKSTRPGNYFDHANDLFWPLFRYLSSHQLTMTTPVEAHMEGASMYFWVSEAEHGKAVGDAADVAVIKVPARRVARLGGRGGYSEANFQKTRAALEAWLASQKMVAADGPAYAVYWNGPFMPGFLKRFEVHIPVRAAASP